MDNENKNTTETELEAAETELEAAETELEAAETELEAAETELEAAETELEAAETEPEAAETELEAAETELEAAETEQGFAETVRKVRKSGETQLCTLCGENPREPESDYCAECEERMSKHRIPFTAWIAGTAVICLSVMAFIIICISSAPAVQTLKGDINASKKCWYSAYKDYTEVSSVMDEINSILGGESPLIKVGSGIKVKTIKAVSECYSPMDAINYALNYFDEDFIASNRTTKDIYDSYKKSMDTYAVISEPMSALFYEGASLEETVEALEAFKGTEGVDDVSLAHFIFIAADYSAVSNEEKLAYLRKLDETAKATGKEYYWMYYQDMADQLFLLGNCDEALEYVDALIKKDRSNFGAYELKLRIYLAQGEAEKAKALTEEYSSNNNGYDTDFMLQVVYSRCMGELEEAKLICEEAINNNYDSVPELHRQYSLIYLLEGNYDLAYEEAFKADSNAYYIYSYMGDSSAYTTQLSNTLYLATYLCKNQGTLTTENAQYIDDILDSYENEELSDQVKAVISGEKTLQQVLTEGVCDLA